MMTDENTCISCREPLAAPSGDGCALPTGHAIIDLNVPSKEERDYLTMEQQVYQDFGPNGLFTVQIVTAAVEDMMERLDELESRIDSLSDK